MLLPNCVDDLPGHCCTFQVSYKYPSKDFVKAFDESACGESVLPGLKSNDPSA